MIRIFSLVIQQERQLYGPDFETNAMAVFGNWKRGDAIIRIGITKPILGEESQVLMEESDCGRSIGKGSQIAGISRIGTGSQIVGEELAHVAKLLEFREVTLVVRLWGKIGTCSHTVGISRIAIVRHIVVGVFKIGSYNADKSFLKRIVADQELSPSPGLRANAAIILPWMSEANSLNASTFVLSAPFCIARFDLSASQTTINMTPVLSVDACCVWHGEADEHIMGNNFLSIFIIVFGGRKIVCSTGCYCR
ncbi:hypothetical protein Lal_00008565 [Lupinus albus]|nr:hypothetical protein Lal_00008565 [Lupinus albus]